METTMKHAHLELDDLRQAWQTLDLCLQRQTDLQRALLHERRVEGMRSRLRPLWLGQIAQLLFGLGASVAGVWLWRHSAEMLPVLVSGIAVHAYGIATIAAAIAVLAGIAGIDRSLPVLELQQRLAKLRRAYIVGGLVVGLPWWLLWMVPPVVFVSLHAPASAAAAVFASPGFWAWLGAGAAGLLGTLGILRWSRRPGREALAQRLDDAAAGSSLRRAQAEVDALAAYLRE
jgi:hypothetical protein